LISACNVLGAPTVTLLLNVDPANKTWEVRVRATQADNAGIDSFSLHLITTGNLFIASGQRTAPAGRFPQGTYTDIWRDQWGYQGYTTYAYDNIFAQPTHWQEGGSPDFYMQRVIQGIGQRAGSRLTLVNGVETLVSWDADVRVLAGTYIGDTGTITVQSSEGTWFNLLEIVDHSTGAWVGPGHIIRGTSSPDSIKVINGAVFMAAEQLAPSSRENADASAQVDVPEPGTLGGAGVTLALFACRRRRRRSTLPRT
jgi:hypothetical protein